MIAKVPDTDRPTDPLNAAGLATEQTMAFYLRRAFKDDPDVFVFNDLRLEHEREVAQIDHLVLHHGGMVIVESKSVSGEVVVNEHGEWTRKTGSRHEGMPSPVLQARRQEALLRAMLRANSERLRDRALMGTLQMYFNRYWPIDVFVAISDRGRITRDSEVPELRKADQVPDEIKRVVVRHKRGHRSLNLLNNDGDIWLSAVEMGRVVQFLLSGHTPKTNGRPVGGVVGGAPAALAPRGSSPVREAPSPTRQTPPPATAADRSPVPASAPPNTPAAQPARGDTVAAGQERHCRHCGSTEVYMRYARTSRPYFYRCLRCDGNTPAGWHCTACGAEARISKRGRDYSRVCTACGTTVHVFTNPEDAPSG
ncbi:MAG: NERD domain-containing protein [Actinobacteria bacterium]|nr:NERD domain-containing protein [Actinomycetota bacterium]